MASFAQTLVQRVRATVLRMRANGWRGLSCDDLDAALADAGVGIALVGPAGGLLHCNATAGRIWGLASEELAQRTFADLFADAPEGGIAAVGRGPRDVRSVHAHGHALALRIHALRMRPVAANVILVIEDLTERVRSEQLLDHQKRVLELMARDLPLNEILAGIVALIEAQAPGALSTIYLVDAEGRLRLGAAPSWPAEFVAAVDGCPIGPEAGSCGAAAFFGRRMVSTDIANGGDPCWGPYREWILSYGIKAAWSTPVLGDGGVVRGTVSMCWREVRVPTARELELVDVATRLMGMAIERARRETLLHEQRARLIAAARDDENRRMLRAIIDSIADGIVATESTGTIIARNRAAADLWRITDEDAGDSAALLRAASRQARDPEALVARFEAQNRDATGGDEVVELMDGRVLEVSVHPLRRSAGSEADGRIWVFRDVTERKRFDAQLQFSDRMASVGRLAAGVAHEINNPMTHVICSIELARGQLTPRDGVGTAAMLEADQLLGAAFGSALRVARIVADLQRISRHDDDHLAPMRVEDALEAAIAIAMSRIRGKCRLVRRYAAVPDIVANEGRLTQVFLNLLVNAAQVLEKSDGEGEITVVIALDDVGSVVVEIRDNGPGMGPDVLAHAFEPFYTTKPIGSGTGLGLSICYALVTALGGRIHLASTVGAGTTVRVELPTGEPAANRAAAVAEAPPSTPTMPYTRLRLLVIDDEQTILDVVAACFGLDADVTAVSEPHRALALLLESGSCPFDVILCDLLMPRMSGADLVERVRHERPGLESRFIFMTGGVLSGTMQDFLDHCPNRVISKPFTIADLTRICREYARGT